MEILENNIQKAEELFRSQKSFLKRAKITMLLLGTAGVINVYFKMVGAQHKYHYPDWQVALGVGFVAIVVYSFILFSPLYTFFADRILQRITWSIKSAILKSVLDKHTNDYHLSFKGILPDEDIKDLELQAGMLQFCYGDDLIFGKLNNVRFRISELHSVSIWGRQFDGLVGVLIFKQILNDEHIKTINEVANNNNTNTPIKYIAKRNKLFLQLEGRKKHFEFRIKRNQINKKDLSKDFIDFNDLITNMNNIANKLNF